MSITWRPATWVDVEASLLTQAKTRGDSLIGVEAAVNSWRQLLCDPSSTVTVLEASPMIQGHRLVGFGAAVLVSPSFADAELANPQPDINSRVIASIAAGKSVLATRSEVARANAEQGVDMVVLCGVWRDDILSPAAKQEAKTLLATSFTERHAGYRIRRIMCEGVDEAAREFIESSIVYNRVAEFAGTGRALYLMTRESARAVPGSLGNVLFSYREPVLRLRESDQQLLRVALEGATDSELATALEVTLSAVKARWRSTFARIAAVMPELVSDPGSDVGRGSQKRHRVLAYIRSHPEELRPYDWSGPDGTAPGARISRSLSGVSEEK